MPRGHYKRKPDANKQTAAPVPASVEAPASNDPLEPNRNIDTMSEPELRVYARQIGVNPRDAAELPFDRLKQNCMLVLAELIEELT